MNAASGAWAPPDSIPRPEVVRLSRETLDLPDIPVGNREDIFRIRALEMDWDIGTMTYAPEDPARIPTAPTADAPASSCCTAAPRTTSRWSPWPACWPRSSASRSR